MQKLLYVYYFEWNWRLCITLVPEVFFRREENIKRQTKKRREKTSGYHATIAVNQHHEIDEQATNNDTCKVPPIRRQGQILTLVQIYWRGKINLLSWATRGFLTSPLSSLFATSRFACRRFTALLLENLWHPG